MALDPRFYRSTRPYKGFEIAEHLAVSPVGLGDRAVTGIAPADQAGEGDLCYCDSREGASHVHPQAGLCLIRAEHVEHLPDGVVALGVPAPRAAFAKASALLAVPRRADDEALAPLAVHPDAVIHPTASVAHGVAIGAGTEIGAGAVIGPGVQIGRNGQVGSLASVHCALLGDNVVLAAGCRIGESGFGVAFSEDHRLVDMPHFGRAILQDRVSIGANSCIDRGMLGDTIIGEDTRIDNLCHIAHNVTIGRGVIIAAFGGISGSVSIGDGAMLGGRVGISDHISVGPGARLAANTALFRDVPAGESWGGAPAKPSRVWAREVAWLSRRASLGRSAPSAGKKGASGPAKGKPTQ